VNFHEAEAYLYSLGNEVETMKLGLENITILLAALGDPQTKYKKVQVAGTNGKGSVCAFLDSICGEAGIRRGLYTSPHLISITERIRIDGADIGEDEFARLATRVRQRAEDLVAEGKLERVPTYFEQVTAMALLAFAEANVELAILETGLGGRYDAVTAANAEIAAITRIDLDHQEYLGETIEEIAAEKAAIIRDDSHVVIGRQSVKAMEVILRRCNWVGATVSSDLFAPWTVELENDGSVRVETTRLIYPSVTLGLKGRHQIENAETALNVLQALKFETELDFSFEVEAKGAFSEGLAKARHPGRLEYIGNFLLDGAHNPSGAQALQQFLDENGKCPTTLVFGAMRDKSVAEIAAILWPRAGKVILTRPSNSRAMTADELAKFAPNSVAADTLVKTGTVAEAMEKAKQTTPPDGLILVTGSLYLVGEVKKILNN